MGQTFRINNGNALVNSITVVVFGYGPTLTPPYQPSDFQIGVAAWKGTRPDSMLYLSDLLVASNCVWKTFTVRPENLTLQQGQQYVLIFTPNNFWSTDMPSDSALGYVPPNGYADGQYFSLFGFQFGVNDLFTHDWTPVLANIVFSINYTVVAPPVMDPCETLRELAALVRYEFPRARPLIASLSNTISAIERLNLVVAEKELNVFRRQVIVQVAPSNPVPAQRLIQTIQQVVDALHL